MPYSVWRGVWRYLIARQGNTQVAVLILIRFGEGFGGKRFNIKGVLFESLNPYSVWRGVWRKLWYKGEFNYNGLNPYSVWRGVWRMGSYGIKDIIIMS
ncbi:MAG: hypothetical protein Kow0079_12890 [Vicingaceae bacterium]